ncbi:MAG: zinc ABC transporter substrate-binding protein [Bdellovibrionales bacterium]|nr:zinc ABC transporter substrate-binding protein [Bdellovibrionales bacterium]
MKNLIVRFIPLAAFAALSAQAKVQVVTTTPDLAFLVQEVGGAQVDVESIAKGSQDPHFIEAKPSYMIKASKADLVISTGLDLEVGWIPSIVRGARNPKVMPGSAGYFEVGPLVPVLEKPDGKISRAEGDVHPDGNPHILLDPIRAGTVAEKIAEKLATLDSAHAAEFKQRATTLRERLAAKTKAWQARIQSSGVKEVVTYHKTLTYFFDRFGLANAALLEPKPGIPPTAPHIVEVTNLIREHHIPVILVESYFDIKPAERIQRDLPGLRVKLVATTVDGLPGIKSLDDMYEALVSAVEGK